ncbi:glycoside hydrolase family 2 TIM barrel-domain containing protein [uncultured Maribacter sp.]|uniref:glycoside hydrolase family 2 protein n=1 Tax=uncultured Maribacter sp. TaxID=431308 RepID=UPI00263A1155|nr:glycoside hydrolase family 2 TIM barrel-domain containing protein [uncultured Maribacter sp.]
MKKYFIVIVMLLFIATSVQAQKKVYLSGEDASTAVNWDFKIDEGRNSGFWTTIPVPSNWEMEGFGYYLYGMDKVEDRLSGIADYRHTFDFKKVSNKRYFIIFQGSMTDTKVKLNGKEVGLHQGGHTEFKFEITNQLQNGSNLLEVNVNHDSSNESINAAERFADYWLFSGIFRPVYIKEVANQFIERVAIDAQMSGDFKMQVFTNGADEKQSVTAQLYDANQNKVGKSFSAKVGSGEFTLLKLHFKDIELWSHEFPNLYSVKLELNDKKEVLHTYEQKFGFRTFEVRDHDGFYLNGKRILLKGASMHSFRPETGRTISKIDMEENLELMKTMNFNFVRSSCYPADSYFYDLCDSKGLLVLSELSGWWRPLDKDVGPKILKELVVRDVNHPSIILWGNGNHIAHTPEFDPLFAKWDIQKRRPLKNEAKANDIFANYSPNWDIVNTTYYPDYATAKKNLFEMNHIYLPNEVLHALYDGGGAANLKTYWDMFEKSKVGGGMTIWALFDEGMMRNDLGYAVDNQGNKAPDGIVGPHGEKKGSSDAVREIWSPVVIDNDRIDEEFNGSLNICNEFSFVNLNQCKINWKLIDFANPDASLNGHRTVAKGIVAVKNIAAGEKGELNIELPKSFIRNDALTIEVYDNHGRLVYDKRMPITEPKNGFRVALNNPFTQSKTDDFTFTHGKTTLRFDENNGILISVLDKGKETSLKNFPFLTYKADDVNLTNETTKTGIATVSKKGDVYVIEAKNTVGFDYIKWFLKPNGEITLDYGYTLNSGKYHYAGIGIEVAANDVNRKRWLGEGPWRIYNNRTEGGLLDVYAIDKKINKPGKIYNGPEFEGFFAPWNWAVFYLNNDLNVGFKNRTDVTLGVLNPVNGDNPKKATWYYPEQEGFFFFDVISAVGSKWKPAKVFGPDAQPVLIDKQITGTVSMFINWNKSDKKAKRVDLEVE